MATLPQFNTNDRLGMQYGLLQLDKIVPPDHLDEGERSFINYISDRNRNIMSHFDGGQMTFSFLIGDKTLLWNSHLGAYSGILQTLHPKPGQTSTQFPCTRHSSDINSQ